MRLFKWLNLLILATCFTAMAGCGGGAASNSSGTLALAVITPAATSQPGTATATYAAADGRNPMGLDISFSTDHPELVALETGTRKVGSDGVAKITFLVTTPQQDTTVRITATTGGLSQFQTFTITGNPAAAPVNPGVAAVPTQIQVLSATPSDGKLALKGTGTASRSENGFVTFKVLDASNQVVSGQVVNFTLSPSNNGGMALTNASLTTQTDGTVTVGVSAGATQVTAQITATLASYPALSASAQFSITSGPPDDDSFSVAAGTLNSESFSHDGVVVPITVRLADHFNNPPPAGTVVLFTTNGGSIDGSGVTDASGTVSVNWTSQAPRPASGRFVILARCVGEESFTDANGNGLADAGEFTDSGDPYLDVNASGAYNVGETYYPAVNGAAYSAGNALYNGMYQGAAYTSAAKSKFIFRNIELVMSTDAANITLLTANPMAGPGQIQFSVSDLNNNPMAAGTTVVVTTDNGTLGGTTSYTVPQTTLSGGLSYAVSIVSDGTASSGTVTITVTSPSGLVTTRSVTVNGV